MFNGQSDLENLRSAAAPRDERLCRHYAARMEPAWTYVPFALLWLWLGAAVASLPLVGFAHFANSSLTGTLLVLSLLSVPALFALVVWSFIKWVRYRRGRFAVIFRDGRLASGAITDIVHVAMGRGGTVRRISIAVDGEVRGSAFISPGTDDMKIGDQLPVLALAGTVYCGVFADGKLLVGSFREG